MSLVVQGKEPDFRKLDELITYANIANDEGDPGQPLKLGVYFAKCANLGTCVVLCA